MTRVPTLTVAEAAAEAMTLTAKDGFRLYNCPSTAPDTKALELAVARTKVEEGPTPTAANALAEAEAKTSRFWGAAKR